MKALRTFALLLVAAALTGCGGGSEPAADRGAAPAAPAAAPAETVLAYVWRGTPRLVRLDAVTLRIVGAQLALGDQPGPALVRSPDGGRLAVGSGTAAKLAVHRVDGWRRLLRLDLGARGFVHAVAWPEARRVVAAVGGPDGEIVVVDPVAGRIVARHELPGVVIRTAAAPGGLVLLLAPVDRIGPATLAVATARGVRTVALPAEAGFSPAELREPGLAVSPDGSRAVVVPGGSRVLDIDLRTLAVQERTLAEPVSLLGRLRDWIEPAAEAKGPMDGPSRTASWVDAHHVAFGGSDFRQLGEGERASTASDAAGVRLVDTRSWSVRTLDEGASGVAVADGVVLAFGGTRRPSGERGVGLRGFSADGTPLFHLFGDRLVGDVRIAGGRAYVTETESSGATTIEVVDVHAGRVVHVAHRNAYAEIVAPG